MILHMSWAGAEYQNLIRRLSFELWRLCWCDLECSKALEQMMVVNITWLGAGVSET
jgi:hypothetical protein